MTMRTLKCPWTEEWAKPEAPPVLPPPYQMLLSADYIQGANDNRRADLMTEAAGQGVGFVKSTEARASDRLRPGRRGARRDRGRDRRAGLKRGRRTMTERALEGIRVVELGQVVSAPYCAKLFADYGADVVKVEPPERRPGAALGPVSRRRAAPREERPASSSSTPTSAA